MNNNKKFIIDMHAHVASCNVLAKSFREGFAQSVYSNIDTEKKNEKTFRNLTKLIDAFLSDESCEKLIKNMDDAGIRHTVLLMIDFGVFEKNWNIENSYKIHSEIKKRFPNRFSVFAGVDPRRNINSLTRLIKLIKDNDFNGVKLYPPLGFSILHDNLKFIFDFCNEFHLPVVMHFGDSLSNLKNDYGRCDGIEKLASLYKNVKFILAHAGYQMSQETFSLLEDYENIYADISGFSTVIQNDKENQNICKIFSESLNSKMLFGSDWPLFHFMSPIIHQVSLLEYLWEKYSMTNDLEILDNILFKNADKVLNL